jgi:hypothetical protein
MNWPALWKEAGIDPEILTIQEKAITPKKSKILKRVEE